MQAEVMAVEAMVAVSINHRMKQRTLKSLRIAFDLRLSNSPSKDATTTLRT